jgi:type II secretory pathway pseudopilin PulG
MKHLSGQSILEVVIATTLISMGVIAALSLTNQSQKTSNYAKTLDSANLYNNQAADYFRNQKTTLGYATLAEKFLAESSGGVATYCLPTLPSDTDNLLNLNPGACDELELIPSTQFHRSLSVDTTSLNTGIIPLTITTSWQDGGDRQATLNLELSQWK